MPRRTEQEERGPPPGPDKDPNATRDPRGEGVPGAFGPGGTINLAKMAAPGSKTLRADENPQDVQTVKGRPQEAADLDEGRTIDEPSGDPTLKTPPGAATPRTPSGLRGRTPRTGSGGGEGPLVDLARGRFGRYQLEGELGRGGMGIVYRALQTDLNRRVALKVMVAGDFADELERRRFLREAESAALLRHANIVSVYDFGDIEGHTYFTMDLIEGESFAARLKRGLLPVVSGVRLMAKIADAVGYAHLRGIIHRDLKPANVMVDEAQEPRLLDFGLAKQLGPDAAARESAFAQTSEGTLVGTPYYMAPEQAAGKVDEIDTRSDVWSLGVMLFETLTGERPFAGGSINEIFLKICHDDPPSAHKARREVDAELVAVISRCLEKEKDRRYPTARDLAEDLNRYLRGPSQGPPERPPVGRRNSVSRDAYPRRKW